MGVCYAVAVIFILIVVLYASLELHYFLRMTLSVILARFCKKRAHILQETSVNGICLTTDIDTLLYHMNNARFIRELDFARVDFYERTGLYRCIRAKGGSIAMGATSIRYRRFIRLFHRYSISTKIIYWDDQSIFMEHRFTTPRDNFVNAIVWSRTRLMDCSADEVMASLLSPGDAENGTTKLKPEMPTDVATWMESNAISSAKLRGNC
ncbi:PREDICTED: protein THEM6-like [Nicrophorus vespilloides]|uniref:Protein THEM6 n=1 Tax=Nicrophorus vespilloides TaxID=110193 RepID=A0ABM1MMS2_NICVS|nr:PREDICTED: protein THEM6-like [Nicrophorus vespilloides]